MISEFVRHSLLQRLADTGHYAVLSGIVKQVTMIEYPEEGVEAKHILPVSCSVSGTELETGNEYQRLTPDSSKRSLGFFENNPYRITDGKNARQGHISGTIRFLAWYNLELIGCSGCETPFHIIESTKEALAGTFDNSPFNGAGAHTAVTSIQDTSPQQAFGRYTFSREQGLFLYPFSFAAYEMTIELEYLKSCVPVVDTGACNCVIV